MPLGNPFSSMHLIYRELYRCVCPRIPQKASASITPESLQSSQSLNSLGSLLTSVASVIYLTLFTSVTYPSLPVAWSAPFSSHFTHADAQFCQLLQVDLLGSHLLPPSSPPAPLTTKCKGMTELVSKAIYSEISFEFQIVQKTLVLIKIEIHFTEIVTNTSFYNWRLVCIFTGISYTKV